jgi:ABC transport permease subunit
MEENVPRIAREPAPQGPVARTLGRWTAAQLTMPGVWSAVEASLAALKAEPGIRWDLRDLQRLGATALPITALVGFLIGVVLAYLTSQQLRQFGADAFIVNILGLSLIRELGPMLAAILIAGRSGSAITAQIGVMRVTDELDAMRVMGIPHRASGW